MFQVVPGIWFGVVRLLVSPVPSWPFELLPQHQSVLSVFVAHVCSLRAVMIALQVVPGT